MNKFFAAFAVFISIIIIIPTTSDAIEGTWANDFHLSGPNGRIYGMIEWQGQVVVAGQFNAIGSVSIPGGVARLGDHGWEPLGQDLGLVRDHVFCIHDEALHLMAIDVSSRRVWRLDGDTWVQLGEDFPALHHDMISYLGKLYVGSLRLEDGLWVDRLQTDDTVLAMTIHDDLLVFAGEFSYAGGQATGPVAAWDGDQVLDRYTGQELEVVDLATFDDQLFAARKDYNYGLCGVQIWNGAAWNDMPEFGNIGEQSQITSLSTGLDRLLGTRYEYSIIIKDSEDAQRSDKSGWSSLKAWDGVSAQSLLTVYQSGPLRAALDTENGLFLPGDFGMVGDLACANLCHIVDGVPGPACEPGQGAEASVFNLASSDAGLAISGYFLGIGGLATPGLAIHDRGDWTRAYLGATGHGIYTPFPMTWVDETLTAILADGSEYECIWLEDSEWRRQYYQDGSPNELVGWSGHTIGYFPSMLVEFIWPIPAPIPFADIEGQASTLLARGDELWVGGDFSDVEGIEAHNIAVLKNDQWSAVGDGLPGIVRELGIYADQVVAAVQLPDQDPAVQAIMILEDGTSWREIGQLVGYVNSMVEYHHCLYVCGYFSSTVEGLELDRFGCWDGENWSPIAGAPSSVNDIAVHDDMLWIGGAFKQAGGFPAGNLTTFTTEIVGIEEGEDSPTQETPAAVTMLHRPAPNPFNPCTRVRFSLERAGHVRLDIHDARGRLVATVVDGHNGAGDHVIDWRGVDANGREMPSGTYLFRLQTEGRVATTKAVLVR